jgi:Ca-activated chloride channel family protein
MFWFFGQLVDRQFSPEDRLPYVEAPSGEQAIELSDLEIQVKVSGLLAETTQTMRFYNPNDRVLEGNLSFPLPDNAVVCGYALDVDGQMVDGVITPKREARRILEAEERKGADPGLLEQVLGNLYRTRIYPIPSRGARTVRVTYISNLTVHGNQAAYHLPLTHAAKIESVALRVEVVQAPVQPVISGGLGSLALNHWEDRWVAEAKLGRGLPAEDLQIRLPDLPDRFTTVENKSGESFFCISSKLGERDGEQTWTPKRVAIAWDASGSRQSLDREYDLLRELLAHWDDTVVDVVVFRNRVEDDPRSFPPGDSQVSDLLAYLQGLPYDGGTDLTALDLSSPAYAECEGWLLFSDGLGTIDPGMPKIGSIPVVAITGQAHCNAALLQYLVQTTAGRYLNLVRTTTAAAVQEIVSGGQAAQIVESDGCEDTHLIAGQGRLAVLGRLTKEDASLAIAGLAATTERLTVSRRGGVGGDLVARAWAGAKTQVLGLTLQPTADEILTLARTHGLVTPGTSLLVLESLEQYLEYQIEPPASLPAMRAAYEARSAENTQAENEQRKSHLDTIVDLWQHRVHWWEQEFEYRPNEQGAKRNRRTATAMRSEVDANGPEDAVIVGGPLDAAEPASGRFAMMAPPAADGVFDADLAVAGNADLPSAAGSIRIKPWTPDTPYLTAMRDVAAAEAYAVYLRQRPEYAASPAFFLDCGDYLLGCGQRELGIRVLSNLVETGLDDPALMRSFAWRLQQADDLDLAIAVLERVREARDDEPQSHRDLALALSRRWERAGDQADAVRAMDLLYHVILNHWENFPEI